MHAPRSRRGRRPSSLHALVAASDRHAAGVCRSLRDGVLVASADVLRALSAAGDAAAAQAALDDAFEQALTIVYRMLFLLFAEARGAGAAVASGLPRELQPRGAAASRRSDGARRPACGTRCARSRGSRTPAAAPATCASRRSTAGCSRRRARRSPSAATWTTRRRGAPCSRCRRARRRIAPGASAIAYRDLGVEQLGAVYETLLDYEPRTCRTAPVDARVDARARVGRAKGDRHVLHAAADRRLPRPPHARPAGPRRRAGADPSAARPRSGDGQRRVPRRRVPLPRGAYEAALVASRRLSRRATSATRERAAIRRTIAERCLYGVDLNPMAVQLARLSLWLATLAADRPLSSRSSPAGRRQPARRLARQPATAADRRRTRRDASTAAAVRRRRRSRTRCEQALPVRFSLESTPNDTLDQVRAKERALAALTARDAALSRWKRVARPLVRARGSRRSTRRPPAAFGALVRRHPERTRCAAAQRPSIAYLDGGRRASRAAQRFFHWELEFPEVFFDADGTRRPRRRLRRGHRQSAVGHDARRRWIAGRARGRASSTSRQCSASRATPASTPRSRTATRTAISCSSSARSRSRAAAGGIGLVLPSGLATDHGSARAAPAAALALRRRRDRRLRQPPRRLSRFTAASASCSSRRPPGAPTARSPAGSAIDDPAVARSASATRRPTVRVVSRSPVAGAARTPLRARPRHSRPAQRRSISRSSSARPRCFRRSAARDGWAARFGRELNATDDRAHFARPARGLPVVEGKHLEPFRVALDGVGASIRAGGRRAAARSDAHERAAARLPRRRQRDQPR